MGRPYAEVIGDPIAHSLSPAIHNFWLGTLGIGGEYRATEVADTALDDFVVTRRADPDWRGCNVAMPHKQAARAMIDHEDPVTRRIGALNTIVRRDSVLFGHNTDWQAINLVLEMDRLRPRKAVIIGTGGAARAALEEMRQSGIERVDLVSRSPTGARALLAEFALAGDVLGPGEVPVADLLINASPLGMHGYPELELDLSKIRSMVFDMVYRPVETELLRRARARGLRTVDGVDMLIHQAAMAFTHFFGQAPDPVDSLELRARLTS